MATLDEIGAEEGFGRESITQEGVERRDIVDGLPVESPLGEVILLDIGNGSAVGVQPGCVGEYPCEAGGGGAGKSNRNARLDDGVALGADFLDRIDLHLIAGM